MTEAEVLALSQQLQGLPKWLQNQVLLKLQQEQIAKEQEQQSQPKQIGASDILKRQLITTGAKKGAEVAGNYIGGKGVGTGLVQGASGIMNINQGLDRYKSGDKVGGALQMTTGAIQTAQGGQKLASAAGMTGSTATSGAGQAGASATGGQTLGQAAKYTAVASDLYAGDQAAKKAQGRDNAGFEASRALGLAVADYFTGGLAGAAAGFAHKQWGGTEKKIRNFMMNSALSKYTGVQAGNRILGGFYTKKSEDQARRDGIRKWLSDYKIIQGKGKDGTPDNYNINFSDGSSFDLGKDGKKLYGKKGTNQLDYNTEGEIVARADALARGMGMKGDDVKAFSFLMGQATSNGAKGDINTQTNRLREVASKLNLNADIIREGLKKNYDNKNLTDAEYNTSNSKIDSIFGGNSSSTINNGIPKINTRSMTTSPGIDKNGRRIIYK